MKLITFSVLFVVLMSGYSQAAPINHFIGEGYHQDGYLGIGTCHKAETEAVENAMMDCRDDGYKNCTVVEKTKLYSEWYLNQSTCKYKALVTGNDFPERDRSFFKAFGFAKYGRCKNAFDDVKEFTENNALSECATKFEMCQIVSTVITSDSYEGCAVKSISRGQ